MKILCIALLMTVVAGCSTNVEKATLRESMDQGTRMIRADHKAWAGKLLVDPVTGKNHADELPKLTQAQYDAMMLAHKNYEELVAGDRVAK